MSMHDAHDLHTIALWLFDEPEYPSVTLTDAGKHLFDLRLEPGGRLTPGLFGNALDVSPQRGKATAYACDAKLYYPAVPPDDRPVTPPARLLEALASSDWTWELHLRLRSRPEQDVVIVELGDSLVADFSIELSGAGDCFKVRNSLQHAAFACATDMAAITDGGWRHVAFVWDSAAGRLTHFLDGAKRSVGDLLTSASPIDCRGCRKSTVFDLSIGSTRGGDRCIDGLIDEMRVSDEVRYRADSYMIQSFSRNQARSQAPVSPSSTPLLFAAPETGVSVAIGARKHLFVDDILIESMQGVALAANPPSVLEPTDFTMDQDWERGSDTKAPNPGDCAVYEHDGEIRFLYLNSAQWTDWSNSNRTPAMCMRISDDGLHFRKPVLDLVEWNGSKENNILTTLPIQGHVVEDTNENVPEDERFKMPAYLMQRGIYMFTSPDGICWRRNETIMLPFDCGGGVEPLFDDQKGLYTCYIRNEAGLGGRSSSFAHTREPMKPWPLEPVENPPVRDVFTLPSLSKELPIPFIPLETGDIYRTRVVKYPWAPDVYLAFVWRHTGEHPNDYRQTELAVSRDGLNWKFFAEPYYIPAGREFNGRMIGEALSAFGIVRRGDEIWQYAMLKTGKHYDSSAEDTLVRVTQRLDGFASLDAEDGVVITKRLIFQGDHLELNVCAHGELRVGLLDEERRPIPGFTAEECDPLTIDSTAARVTWRGRSEVGALAGRPVRLQFEMKDTKLYAFQFVSERGAAI